MKNEHGQGIVEYAVILFLVVVVAVIVIGLMFAGDAIGTGDAIRKADSQVSEKALKACRKICRVTYGPGGNYESPSKLIKCYNICGD